MKLNERLAIASKHLLNANLSLALKSIAGYTEEINPAFYREAGNWFNAFGDGTSRHFTWAGHKSSLTAYQKCPPVAAIVNRQAQAYINGKTWVLNSKGKESTTAEAKTLKKLLARPNLLQSWKQFEAQNKIYQTLAGYTVVLMIRPAGFKDPIDTTAMWNIPPYLLEIVENDRLFYQTDIKGMIKEVWLHYKGTRTKLDLDNLLIMKDYTPSFDTLILPESRLKALELPINNVIGAYESRNVLINYRGAMGILSNEQGAGQYANMPFTEKEKENLQKDFSRYGLKQQQWRVIMTSASLKWQQMGYPTKDLMLMEEVSESSIAICNGLNFPPFLLALSDSTYNNQNTAEKGLYQNSIIPDAESNYEQWNQYFQTEEMNLRIDKDFSHIPVLQEDQVQQMTARRTRDEAYKLEWENDLCTLNEWRIANGDDPLPPEAGNLRRSELAALSSTPLAVSIGVGGVQSLIGVLTAPISADSKRNTLEIVFGIPAADAARMVSENENQNQNGNQA